MGNCKVKLFVMGAEPPDQRRSEVGLVQSEVGQKNRRRRRGRNGCRCFGIKWGGRSKL